MIDTKKKVANWIQRRRVNEFRQEIEEAIQLPTPNISKTEYELKDESKKLNKIMLERIAKSKLAIKKYLADNAERIDDVSGYKRLLKLNGAQFFCHLAAMNIALGYRDAIMNWVNENLTSVDVRILQHEFNNENHREHLMFFNSLLLKLMPMLYHDEVKSWGLRIRFKKLVLAIKSGALWNAKREPVYSKFYLSDIYVYLHFSLWATPQVFWGGYRVKADNDITADSLEDETDTRFFARISILAQFENYRDYYYNDIFDENTSRMLGLYSANHIRLLMYMLDFHNKVCQVGFLIESSLNRDSAINGLFEDFKSLDNDPFLY